MQHLRLAFVPLITACLISALKAGPLPAEPPMPGKLVDVGGYRVHLYCTGNGSPAVIVVGGGFSADWGLVQPEVARFTNICTYDPAGSAWSDKPQAPPSPGCSDRVSELKALLASSGVPGPYVLVGYSIGGLIARLFETLYPDEIAGMVIVDHAFIDTASDSAPNRRPSLSMKDVDTPPVLISKTPISLDMADDENFSKLSARDQQIHRWALSVSTRPTVDMARKCFSEVAAAEAGSERPLGKRPLAVVSILYDSPRYRELQKKLLALSETSEQIIAANSSHMVIIDQPEVVVRAIRDVVDAVSLRSESIGASPRK